MKKYIAIPIMLAVLWASPALAATTINIAKVHVGQKGGNLAATVTINIMDGAAIVYSKRVDFSINGETTWKADFMAAVKEKAVAIKAAYDIKAGSSTFRTDLQAEINK